MLLNKVFVGPAGTTTRLHFDAHSSHAWLAQVQGRKLFVLFPPNTQGLRPLPGEQTTQSPIDPLDVAARGVGGEGGAGVGLPAGMRFAVLKRGETLLVPDGWWHYAASVEQTVTVMRNFYEATTNVRGLVELFAENFKMHAQAKRRGGGGS